MSTGRPPRGASVLRLAVSTDGGRTFTGRAVVAVPHQWAAEVYGPLGVDPGWPPCTCPLHRREPADPLP